MGFFDVFWCFWDFYVFYRFLIIVYRVGKIRTDRNIKMGSRKCSRVSMGMD